MEIIYVKLNKKNNGMKIYIGKYILKYYL